MSQLVVMGAMLTCTFGTTPDPLVVVPAGVPVTGPTLVATIMDYKPGANIATFGMCKTMSNPVVAASTAAKKVFTPMPCVPATATPWVPGSPTVLINNVPALSSISKCACSYGGVISITSPGQVTVQVP